VAARKQNWHTEETRQKIKVSQLLNRLNSHAEGELELSPTQLRAIEILLKKSLPDLQSIQISGEMDSNLTVNIVKRTYADD
jgi:hypothetical protein